MGLLSLLNNFFSSSKKSHEKLEQDQDNEQIPTIGSTILIIDDSKTQLATCEKWLGAAGYHTITALDGREGILKTNQEHPDLIFMDIVMPDINGFQATRHLKRQPKTRHIPIVLVSGEEQASGKAWAKKLGACCFMVKPVSKAKLLTLTSRILNHTTIHQE
jgi:twitching motility two-component system response regulator PilH